MKSIREILYYSLIAIAFTLIAGYAYFETSSLRAGPEILVIHPQNGQNLESDLLSLRGKTKNVTDISLNNRKIFIDEEGFFKEELLLFPGYNVVKLEAKDRFGKIDQQTLTFFVKESEKQSHLINIDDN